MVMPANLEQRKIINRRYRARQRGEDVPLLVRQWTAEEEARLRAAYATNLMATGWLVRLAEEMGRDPGNLARKAKEIGIARDPRRPRPRRRRMRQTSIWSLLSPRTRLGKGGSRPGLWSKHPHPRGMLGKKHSEEARKQMSLARFGVPRPHSDATRAAMSRARVNALRLNPEAFQRGSRGRGGRRADLENRYFRSRWEANYARYLTFAGVAWEYEPKTFWFESIKRGARSYTPDFWLPRENCYHEVKGWMDDKSKTKLARMAKFYPDTRLVVIDKAWFAQAERQGLCRIIPGWECKHSRLTAAPVAR